MRLSTNEKGAVAKITFKTGRGLVREELEEEVPAWLADKVAELAEALPITKERFRLTNGYDFEGLEIDRFYDNLDGLIVAEKKFDSEEEAAEYILPRIVSEHVVREVTEDLRYVNLNLARSQEIPTEI